MNRLTLTCTDCQSTHTFTGDSVTDLMHAIDASGWVDQPSQGYALNPALCPACDKLYQETLECC